MVNLSDVERNVRNKKLRADKWDLVIQVSFRTGTSKYNSLEDTIFVESQTVKSSGRGAFKAGVRISKLYSPQTKIMLYRWA